MTLEDHEARRTEALKSLDGLSEGQRLQVAFVLEEISDAVRGLLDCEARGLLEQRSDKDS